MKQLEVQIMGQTYVLTTPEDREVTLLHAVKKVDEAMCQIRDRGKIKARDRIAVLAALNLAAQGLTSQSLPATSVAASQNISANHAILMARIDEALVDKN